MYKPKHGQHALLLIMKISLVQILISCFSVAMAAPFSTTAQEIMDERISIHVQNTEVKAALTIIAAQVKVKFAYSPTLFSASRKITLDMDEAKLSEVLAEILDPNIEYKVVGRHIALVPGDNYNSDASAIPESERNAPLTGKVTDENNEGLIGVTIMVKGTTRGTITDADGEFSIDAEPGEVLQFSSIGYVSQDVTVGAQTFIELKMLPDVKQLSEVVVIGYGEQRKVSMTNSVATVNSEQVTARPVGSVQQALQGQAPGLTVLDQGGSPGRTNTTMRVRGTTTIDSTPNDGVDSNAALVIVDGIEQQMTNINPQDIESVSILKDAASTAIYGSRAANGVILITTKRAKPGKVTVSYNGYYALQHSINTPQMDLPSYMKLEQTAFTNAKIALPAMYTDQGIADYLAGVQSNPEQYPTANEWFKTLLTTAPQTNHNISVSGGNETIKARLSVRSMKQNSILDVPMDYGSNLNDIRLNTDYSVSKTVTVSADINYRNNYSLAPVNEGNVFDRFVHGSLFATPKYTDALSSTYPGIGGTYGMSTQGNNPRMIAEKDGTSKRWDENIFASMKGSWEIVKGLKLTSQLALRIDNTRQKNFTNAYSNTDPVKNVTKNVVNNSLTEIRNNATEYTWINMLNYDRMFGKHEVKGLLGYTTIDNKASTLSATRQRFYNNDIQSIGQGANDGTKDNSGADAQFGLRSFFARANYSYADKYLFEVNGRYDGSSRFIGKNQYSFFPSVSAGWRLSEENFLREINAVDELKLRASWGKSGNQSVGLYSYYQSLTPNAYSFGGVSVVGYRPATIANTDITWETTAQTDIGIDARLFGGFNFSIDYYNKRTDGILLTLPIPATIGLGAPPQNAGVVDNKGVEVLVGYRNIKGKIRYGVSLNGAANRNKVVSLAGTGPYITGSDIDPLTIVKEGLPLNTQWGYQTDGLFQTQEEVDSYPNITTGRGPGDVKYVDRNEDGKIDANDRTVIGKSFPDFTYGINGNIGYKAFELTLFFQGASGVDTRLAGGFAENGNNEGFVPKIVSTNYWTPENPNARFPRPLKRDLFNMYTSDRLIVDGSYLRLKNIQLAYTFPSAIIEKLRMTNFNVYVSATNLLTFSKLKEWGLDPEVGNGRATYYPQVGLWTLGANIQF